MKFKAIISCITILIVTTAFYLNVFAAQTNENSIVVLGGVLRASSNWMSGTTTNATIKAGAEYDNFKSNQYVKLIAHTGDGQSYESLYCAYSVFKSFYGATLDGSYSRAYLFSFDGQGYTNLGGVATAIW